MTYKPVSWITILLTLIAQAISAGAGQDSLNSADRHFIEDAARGNLLEIELGSLAVQRTARPDILAFAGRMIYDHAYLNKNLARIAEANETPLPLTVDEGQNALIDELIRLTGDEFDRRYLEIMVDEHRETLESYTEQAEEGEDPQLLAFAENALPMLQRHYEQAQLLQKKFTRD
jgi:putative membrane protein